MFSEGIYKLCTSIAYGLASYLTSIMKSIFFLVTFLSICITRMSSKIQSLEKYIELFTYEFSKMKIIVLDIKEFFKKWMEKQAVGENNDEMQLRTKTSYGMLLTME